MAEEICKEFVVSVKSHNPQLLNRPKIHLLLHLPKCMLEFGRTSSFNTERLGKVRSRKVIMVFSYTGVSHSMV